MQLGIEEAAKRLGKSARQMRYLIQTGQLPAKKTGGRWLIEAQDLPLSEKQRAAIDRREKALRGAVERGLGLGEETPRRYSVRDLKAFQIALPLYRQACELLGAEHAAVNALRESLVVLSRGCHRYAHDDKADAYRNARDAASLASASCC
jgi:excisionase family DNA binding protein